MYHEKKRLYLSLAVIAAVLLVASVTIVPTLEAFADHDDGNHKSKDNKHRKHDFFVNKCPKDNGKYHHKCFL